MNRVNLRVVKIFLNKDDSAILSYLILLRLLVIIGCSSSFRGSLRISLPISVKGRQFLVILPSDFALVVVDLQLGRIDARLRNLFG